MRPGDVVAVWGAGAAGQMAARAAMPLGQAPQGYAMFQAKLDGCVRSVFRP